MIARMLLRISPAYLILNQRRPESRVRRKAQRKNLQFWKTENLEDPELGKLERIRPLVIKTTVLTFWMLHVYLCESMKGNQTPILMIL